MGEYRVFGEGSVASNPPLPGCAAGAVILNDSIGWMVVECCPILTVWTPLSLQPLYVTISSDHTDMQGYESSCRIILLNVRSLVRGVE